MFLIFALMLFAPPAEPSAFDDPRLCGPPERTAAGIIKRRADVLTAFERTHPKPGPDWYRDHVIPLACGGCDSVGNLQWLPRDQWRAKMHWERKVYGGRGMSKACP